VFKVIYDYGRGQRAVLQRQHKDTGIVYEVSNLAPVDALRAGIGAKITPVRFVFFVFHRGEHCAWQRHSNRIYTFVSVNQKFFLLSQVADKTNGKVKFSNWSVSSVSSEGRIRTREPELPASGPKTGSDIFRIMMP